MGLFDMLKKRRNTPESPSLESVPAENPSEGGPYSQLYIDVLSRCIGVARLRQQKFGEWIGERDWDLDLEQGTLSYGENTFSIGVIGSESQTSNTWRWSVDNVNGFREELIRDVGEFYRSKLLDSLPELKQTTLSVDPFINGHNIASILTISKKGNPACYYRCPYENGAVYVLVKNIPSDQFSPVTALEAVHTFQELAASLSLNHQLLVEGVFQAYCENAGRDEQDPNVLFATFPNHSQVFVTFDEQGEIGSVRTEP